MKFIKVTIYSFVFLVSLGFFNVAQGATEVIRTIKPSGQEGDYTSLAAWEAGENKDLVAVDEIAVAKIDGDWSTPDTTSVIINGWTTDTTRYIKIYTTEQARHSGKWNDQKYRLLADSTTGISIGEEYVKIYGLQLEVSHTTAIAHGIAPLSAITSGATRIEIAHNIVVGVFSSGTYYGYGISSGSNVGSQNVYIWNNIVYNWKNDTNGCYGIYMYYGVPYAYNNTIIDNYFGSRTNTAAVFINNLTKGSGNFNSYLGTYAPGTDYNATDGTDAIGQGSNNKISQTFSFVNESQKDFHLASNDLGARDSGANLFSDANLPITDDIDGQARSTSSGQAAAWDIGADEVGGNTRVIFSPDPGQETNFGAATAIYRSVGPSNTTALAVGTSNTLTITGSTATFSSPLPDRIGVGDALQYDDDNDSDIDVNDSIVFIHSRTDSKTFTVKTASGGSPTSIASDNNWSIFRAYTSLSLAESGTENTGIDADLRAFDTWTGGKDIATSNEVWNIAAYGDAPDTTAVTIDGWTTDADNYIRIYTPVSKEEVGVSQRHRGKWDSARYRIMPTSEWSASLTVNDDYVIIEGLQITNLGTQANNSDGVEYDGAGELYLSGSIIKTTRLALDLDTAFDSSIKLWNNIIYDFITDGIRSYHASDLTTLMIYNNTVQSDTGTVPRGIYIQNASNLYLKNNLVQYGTVAIQNYSLISNGSQTTSNNLSEDATSPDISYRNKAVSFVNEINDDFHLHSADTVAKNYGADLADDIQLLFSTDIDGQARVGSWDIGADERPANTVIKGGIRIIK